MVSKWVITYLYPNHLLTSWDIQEGRDLNPKILLCSDGIGTRFNENVIHRLNVHVAHLKKHFSPLNCQMVYEIITI